MSPSRPSQTGAQKRASTRAPRKSAIRLDVDAPWVIRELKKLATKHTRDGMARYAIASDRAFGVAVGDMHQLVKRIGKNHVLAQSLWLTGWYEARMMAVLLDEPERVTPAQMNRWCKDFDSWAICDTACFHLFDRTPHAYAKIAEWATRKKEFEKRAAFALMASVGLHVRDAEEAALMRCLPIIERAATDERNFVKKGVLWALRGLGARNDAVRAKAQALARRLARSSDATERWIGRTALREWGLAIPK